MPIKKYLIVSLVFLFVLHTTTVFANVKSAADLFLGEVLEYDISFLWFNRLAKGTIAFTAAENPGTYRLIMQASTRGIAARFTSNRIEKFETIVDLKEDGSLRPLVHTSYRIKGRDDQRNERLVRYTFDYDAGTILYQRIRNDIVADEEIFEFELDSPVYDVVSALYNFRYGLFGFPDGSTVYIPTFHHRMGKEYIEIDDEHRIGSSEQRFFDNHNVLYRAQMDPSVFDARSRDVFVSFDDQMRLQKGIIKRIVGLGDLRGELRNDHTH